MKVDRMSARQLVELARRRAGRLGVGTALVVALLAIGPLAGGAQNDPALERDLLALTNADRTSNGLPSLAADARLVEIARERSDDMVARNYFSHDIPPDGRKVFDLMLARGVDYETAGENIAQNNAARDGTVQLAQQGFMNSPGHRQNILRSAFTTIGIGVTQGGGRFMYTVVFMRPFATEAGVPIDLGSVSADGGGPASPVETVVDSVIGRNLGLD
jgi:uncharacterized protein YkwD